MNKLNHIKIFVASPGGLLEERKVFRDTIIEFNEMDAIERGYYFQPVGWEDTLGHQGRPQEIINEDLKKCDFMFLILHNRWGSPSTADNTKYSSGTEEEFHVALECLNSDQYPMRRISLFFKDILKEQLADPGEQLKRVIAFKKEREEKKDFLFETFDNKESFSKQIKYHLTKILRELELATDVSKNKVKNHIDTTFKNTDFEWLDNIQKYNNWDMAYQKAQEYLKQGKIIEAELIFSQISQRSNNPFLIARYGKHLRKMGRISSALHTLESAEKIANAINDTNAQGYIKRQLGRVSEYQGKLHEALDLFNKAIDIYKNNFDQLSIARTQRDISFVQSKLGKSDLAIENIQSSISIYQSNNQLNDESASLSYLGMIYKDLGNFSDALASYNKALSIQEKLGNHEAIANIFSNIGVVYRLQRLENEALEMHNKAIEIFQKLGNMRGVAREYSNIAVILRRKGEYQKAIEKHFASIEIENQFNNERGLHIQYSNIGMNYLELNDFKNAEHYFVKSLEYSKKLDDIKGESHQHKNFCSLYIKQKQYDLAIEEAKKSIHLDGISKNKFGLAGCYRLLASIHIEQGAKEKYLVEIKTARNLYLEMGLEKYVNELDEEIEKATHNSGLA